MVQYESFEIASDLVGSFVNSVYNDPALIQDFDVSYAGTTGSVVVTLKK